MTVLEGNDDFWQELPTFSQGDFQHQAGLCLSRWLNLIHQDPRPNSWVSSLETTPATLCRNTNQSLKGGGMTKNPANTSPSIDKSPQRIARNQGPIKQTPDKTSKKRKSDSNMLENDDSKCTLPQ